MTETTTIILAFHNKTIYEYLTPYIVTNVSVSFDYVIPGKYDKRRFDGLDKCQWLHAKSRPFGGKLHNQRIFYRFSCWLQ